MSNLLKCAGINAGPALVESHLASHPSYPSVLAMADFLEDLGVGAMAARVPANQLGAIAPAIVHLSKGQFALVAKATEQHVDFIDADTGASSRSLEEFSKHWSGAAIFLRGPSEATPLRRKLEAEASRVRRRRLGLSSLCAAGCLSLCGLALLGSQPVLSLLWLGLTFLGLITSMSLVSVGMGQDFGLSRALCTIGQAAGGCRSVLLSPMGKVLGVAMADIGLVYFSAQLVLLTISVTTGAGPPGQVFLLAILAAPYTFFSVVYQALVVRQWCKLCLVVQAVLLSQAALAILRWADVVEISLTLAVLTLAAVFAVTIAGWMVVKSWIGRALAFPAQQTQLHRLRRSPHVVHSSLAAAPVLPFGELAGDLVVGAPAVAVTIEIVTSLECQGCKNAYLDLMSLLRRFGDKLAVRVRFTGLPAAHPLASIAVAVSDLAVNGHHQDALSILETYYRTGEGPTPTHGTDNMTSEATAALKGHGVWCRDNGINVTPTIVVNGHHLPTSFQMNDLRFWIASARPLAPQTSGESRGRAIDANEDSR